MKKYTIPAIKVVRMPSAPVMVIVSGRIPEKDDDNNQFAKEYEFEE